MIIFYVLIGLSLFVGVLNLVSILFLSNAFFRLMVSGREPVAPPPHEERGLVDLKESGTYDPRFRS